MRKTKMREIALNKNEIVLNIEQGKFYALTDSGLTEIKSPCRSYVIKKEEVNLSNFEFIELYKNELFFRGDVFTIGQNGEVYLLRPTKAIDFANAYHLDLLVYSGLYQDYIFKEYRG